MSRKKVKEEDKFEDEKPVPDEINNCFAHVKGGCTALAFSKLSKAEKINCGTTKCPFYKPKF